MSENLPEVKSQELAPAMVDNYQPPKLDLMNSNVIDQVSRIAEIMCHAKVTVPKHLVGSKGDCFAIALQAAAWGMSPFTVAQKTHLVNGFLGYEAQLVNAVILSSRLIRGRFTYEWDGEGQALKCRAGATVRGEAETTWGTWSYFSKQVVKNSPLWNSDPAQQLAYLAVKKWARLYCPDVIAGVYTPDELEETGQVRTSLDDALGERQVSQLDEAFGGQETSPKANKKEQGSITCPDSGDTVPPEDCKNYKASNGCPAHNTTSTQKAGLKMEGF